MEKFSHNFGLCEVNNTIVPEDEVKGSLINQILKPLLLAVSFVPRTKKRQT